MTAMQVELGAAQIGETLKDASPTRRISIRPGFIFELQSTDKVTNNLTDAVLFEEPFLLTVLLDRRRPMEIAHLELCRQQSASNSFFLYEELVKSGKAWANEILGTKLVHGLFFVGVQIQAELRRF